MDTIPVNKIAQSGLITLDLEKIAPTFSYCVFDIKDYLFHGLILKEKDFRTALKEHDWNQYTDKDVVVFCSTDAIIPMWAYMLLASYIEPIALKMYTMSEPEYLNYKWLAFIQSMDITPFKDQKMIIKGCSEKPIPPTAYAAITSRLYDYAASIMYGEPCSTVPVYKRKKEMP